MKKLEILLEKDKNYLYKCAYCQKLFTKDQRRHLTCSNGKPFINAYGQLRAKHVIDKSWDLKKFITYIRETYRISWKEIYWKIWAQLYLFKCDRCQEYYPLSELGNCSFHLGKPRFEIQFLNPEQSTVSFTCCTQKLDIYDVLKGTKSGCQ